MSDEGDVPTVPPAGVPLSRPAPLALWPAADWRFLLPPAPLQAVGYLGAVSEAERRVLDDAGVAVVCEPPPGSDVDVCIVSGDEADSIAAAASAVRAGGWVLLRLHSRGAFSWTGVRRIAWRSSRRRARANGLTLVATYWHAPSADRCSYVVAVDDRLAISAMLQRYHGVRLGWLKSVIARAVNAVGLAELLALDVTVVALRDGEARQPRRPARSGFATVLPEEIEMSLVGDRGEPPSRLMVTPWFEASRHVVCLYLDRETRQPCGVAKLPRRTWDIGGIQHESLALQELAKRTRVLSEQVPLVHELQLGQRPFLLESALHGSAVGPETVRSDTAPLLNAALEFVASLPTTGHTDTDASWFVRLIESPLRELEGLLDLSEVPSLVSQTLRCLEPLQGRALPLVFEHGDFSHPNLLLTDGGHLAAVDWERSEPLGLPLHDLCFFMQYVAECLAQTSERQGQLRAFDDAFTGPDAWTQPWLRRYGVSIGLDDVPMAGLVLATWARSAGGLLARIMPSEGRSTMADGSKVSSELADVVRGDRDFQLWQHAVDRFDRLLM